MKHQHKGKTLGRKKAPREAMMRNLATSFMVYESISTTKAKAQLLRPMVEKLITLAKENKLHNRRQALKVLYTDGSVRKLFEVIGPRFKERSGGYTRIIKTPRRQGDNAETAVLELIEKTEGIEEIKKPVKKTTKKTTKKVVKKPTSAKTPAGREEKEEKVEKKEVKKEKVNK